MSIFGWDYPPGVTGREPQIVGPSVEEELLGFIEDWKSEIRKIEDRVYEIAKEIDGELGEGENPELDDAITDVVSGTSSVINELQREIDHREEMMYGEVEPPEREYDDDRY